MYPNIGNMIVVPLMKRMEIIISIQVCLISWINCKENGGKKASLANPKHQYLVSQWGENDCSARNKKNEDYYEYPSLPHFIDELWL